MFTLADEGTLLSVDHPLKAASEATASARRAWVRAGLLGLLLALSYLPFHFEHVTIGWAAFAASLCAAGALAGPLAKKLFTPFDTVFEAQTGLNYTIAVSGAAATRDKAAKVEAFLAAHSGRVIARRTAKANVTNLIVAVAFGLFFTVLTVMDYRARMSQPIKVKLPDGFEHLQARIAPDHPGTPGVTFADKAPSPLDGAPGVTETPIDPNKGADVFTGIGTRTMPNLIKNQQSLVQAKEAIEAVKQNPAQAQAAVEPVKQAIADLKELARDENLPASAREKIGTTAEHAEDVLHSLEELSKDPSDKARQEDFFDKAKKFLEKLLKFLEFLADLLQKLNSIYEQVFGDGAGSSDKTKDSAKGGKGSKGDKDAKGSGSSAADPGRADKMRESLKKDLSRGSGHVVTAVSGKPGGTGGTSPPADTLGSPGSVDAKGGPHRTGDLGSAKAKQQLQTKDKGRPSSAPR